MVLVYLTFHSPMADHISQYHQSRDDEPPTGSLTGSRRFFNFLSVSVDHFNAYITRERGTVVLPNRDLGASWLAIKGFFFFFFFFFLN